MKSKFFVTVAVIVAVFAGISQASPITYNFESGDLSLWGIATSFDASASVVNSHAAIEIGATGTTSWTASEGTSFALLKTGEAGIQTSINISFAANQGDTLSFDYFWDSGDEWTLVGGSPFNDYATAFIARGDLLVMESVMTDPQDFWGTEWQTVNYTFADSGTYSLWYTVTNVGDEDYDSYMGIDNINVTPEPATMALLALGGLMIRKRKA